jgi:hypothetical protein
MDNDYINNLHRSLAFQIKKRERLAKKLKPLRIKALFFRMIFNPELLKTFNILPMKKCKALELKRMRIDRKIAKINDSFRAIDLAELLK